MVHGNNIFISTMRLFNINMKKALFITLILTLICSAAYAQYNKERGPRLAPDGTFVGNTPNLAPDGSYVGGQPQLAPDGTYVGGGGMIRGGLI